MERRGAPPDALPLPVFVSELVGMALLAVGLSLVIVMFGAGSPVKTALPSEGWRSSLGPALGSGQWQGWWICRVGPLIGSIAGCLVCSFLAKRITVAKLYHLDSDRDRLFRRMSPPIPRAGEA